MQAYNKVAPSIATYKELNKIDQLYKIVVLLHREGDIKPQTTLENMRDDLYGYLVQENNLPTGCTKAAGLCLNMLGIPYEYIKTNLSYCSWCRVNINGAYWLCDAYRFYWGPESTPYTYPILYGR